MIKRRTIKLEVTFINLIDVMLVLLIIFMMATPTIQNWVDINLPKAEVTRARITEGIVVSITKDGSVYIDREKVSSEQFKEAFRKVWEDRSGEPVFIRADGDVQYRYVINVVGIARNLGGENVGLVVEEKPTRMK